jgi:hypothetical protein
MRLMSAGASALLLVGCTTISTPQEPGTPTKVTPTNLTPTSTTAASNAPVPTQNPSAQPVRDGALERTSLTRLNGAVLAWNNAASPVMVAFDTLDPDNPSGFGDRTAADRALMHDALSQMQSAIDPAADAAFNAALRKLVGTYEDKLEAMDALAVAFEVDDFDAGAAAFDKWEAAISGQRTAASELLAASRFFLSR